MRGTKYSDVKGKRLSKSDWNSILRLYKYILPYKLTFALGLVFLFFSTSASLIFPYIFGSLIDIVNGTEKMGINSINDAAIILLVVLTFQAFFSYFRIILFAKVSENGMGHIRKSLYKHIIHLPLFFFEKNRIGDITSRFTADISLLRETLSTTSAEFLRQLATLIFGTSLLFYFSTKLTFFMLATFPVLVILALIFGKFIKKLSKKTQEHLADSNVIVDETFQSVNMVKSFTNEDIEIKRYNIEIANVIQAAIHAARYRGAFASFIIAALFGGIILVLWYGATLVSDGGISIGDLVTYLFYTIYIGASVGGMGEMYGQIQKAAGAAERVLSIMDETPEEPPKKEARLSFNNGNIVYDDVHFEYPGRKDFAVLKGISINIAQGEKVALVGKSGSGKSTITHLLSRFYKLEKGEISIADQNIKDITINSLRNNIGIVPQEIILFGGSIRENILYGKPNASEKDIITAAKSANAWEFIRSFPEGLDTTVGDRGIQLSGGQKQRIAIARTILKDPAILILDEATSSLDAVSEKAVQEAMDKLMQGRTSIIIAHRLSTVQNVDKIFVVMDGVISEMGKHHDLIAKEGNYHQLIKYQFSQERV